VTSSRFRRRRRQPPAFKGDFQSDESITETMAAIQADEWDGATFTFDGASAGTMPPAEARREAGLQQAVTLTDPDTRPLGMLRAQPPYPAAAPPGYAAAATGPLPAIGRERPAIGDALALDEQWGPKLTNLPCGHCGATLDADRAVTFERTRVIGYLNWLARQDGWVYDADLIWTCTACQQHEGWKARQGPLEVHRDVTCQRNHLAASPQGDCTCPGAVLAVDVMLASEDHLGRAR
jgi:hypothetical protein